MKKHSTGSLTPEEKASQDENYKRVSANTEYDYLVIGSGNAALVCAALLANAGYRICLLESHDTAGGYAHTFRAGQYKFCAQVHYIWSCHPGGNIYELFKKLGLLNKVGFSPFDPDGYDHMIMPDGKRVKIPCGWDAVEDNIVAAYPQTSGLSGFMQAVRDIRAEMQRLPKREIKYWDIALKRFLYPKLNRYRKATLQDLFDEYGVSLEARTILAAQAGDFLLPPNRLSILFYVGLLAGYNTGAYAPAPGFDTYIDELVQFIRGKGGDVFFEEQVSTYQVEKKQLLSVGTDSGKTFRAKNFIAGADPKKTADQIGLQHFPPKYLDKLNYTYSDSGLMIYLGMKPTFDPHKYGLGNHNTWHCLDWDMNVMWDAGRSLDLEKAWFFISTPTLHNGNKNTPTLHTLEIGTYVPHELFKNALQDKRYLKLKSVLADRLLSLVAQHHIPDLHDHIEIKLVGSPLTNEDFCLAPMGNAYGAEMTPDNVAPRLGARTPIKNLFWCNATSGSPGIYGTATTGINLYTRLTGDAFLQQALPQSDEALVEQLHSLAKV